MRELICTWACSRCRAATSLPRTRLPLLAPCSRPICSSSGAEPGVPPVSPRPAPPSPGGWPWWPRCQVWHYGCILPLLTASQGWLDQGCPQRGQGCHDALSRWARNWLRHRPTGFVQSTLSGRAASPQGCVISLGVLPQPCLSPPSQEEDTTCPGSIYFHGAHPTPWVSCPPFPTGRLISWWSGVPSQDTLWGPGPLCFMPWDRRNGAGGHWGLCQALPYTKGGALALSWSLLFVSCVCKDLFYVNTSL